MAALEIHKFYCLNCGREGLPVWRNPGQRRKQLHRKKLYCPWCKATLNHIEITSAEEEEKFKEDFSKGVYTDEAARTLDFVRATGLG